MKSKMVRSFFVLTLSLFACSTLFGCASLMLHTKSEQVHEYAIKNAGYDVAYTKALKAITNMGFSVFQSDKSSGTFTAHRGTGFTEVSEFNFMIERNGSAPVVTIRIKSNKPDEIKSEFLKTYGKFVRLQPAT